MTDDSFKQELTEEFKQEFRTPEQKRHPNWGGKRPNSGRKSSKLKQYREAAAEMIGLTKPLDVDLMPEKMPPEAYSQLDRPGKKDYKREAQIWTAKRAFAFDLQLLNAALNVGNLFLADRISARIQNRAHGMPGQEVDHDALDVGDMIRRVSVAVGHPAGRSADPDDSTTWPIGLLEKIGPKPPDGQEPESGAWMIRWTVACRPDIAADEFVEAYRKEHGDGSK